LQADVLLAPTRESEASKRAVDALEAFFRQPEPQTTLVLVAGALDKRTRMYKLLLKQATLVECGVIEDQADAERWVTTRVAAGGARIDPAAARLLAERAGTDLKRLRGEVDRLLLYALGQKTIAVDDARQVAGPAALLDQWAMIGAIETGNVGDALRQLALALEAGAAPEKILGQLGWVVRARFPQVAPNEIEKAVESLFRTDQALKRSNRSSDQPRILLERLIVELCAGKRSRGTRPDWR
jgi:DNA polymerase III delta subunit